LGNDLIHRGRQVVVPLTNRSGETISAGDVVVVDSANDESFTTSTTSNYSGLIGIAQETIGLTSNGRVLVGGYAPLVNTTGTVTRGLGLYQSTTAKKAQDGAKGIGGQFGELLTGGTSPTAIVFDPLLSVSASLSFASNSNDVSSTGAAGSSTLLSRADHVHRGVTSLAHSSNTFYGPITLTTPGNTVAITSPSSGTLALSAPGATGGGASSDLSGEELDYVEKTGNTTITATTEGTADVVVTSSSVVFDGTPVWIEFWSPFWTASVGGTSIIIGVLRDDTAGASVGKGPVGSNVETNAGDVDSYMPVIFRRRLTPAAGARVYSFRAFVSAGTGTIVGGAGGNGNYMPAYLRITRV
jgi:hypothetical protein